MPFQNLTEGDGCTEPKNTESLLCLLVQLSGRSCCPFDCQDGRACHPNIRDCEGNFIAWILPEWGSSARILIPFHTVVTVYHAKYSVSATVLHFHIVAIGAKSKSIDGCEVAGTYDTPAQVNVEKSKQKPALQNGIL